MSIDKSRFIVNFYRKAAAAIPGGQPVPGSGPRGRSWWRVLAA